ncbi:MAG: 6-phosphofructokinase [bacterium]
MTRGRNILYAQSGGVTAVINASAAGVIETARRHRDRIGKVYAGRNGIIGALNEDLIDTSRESDAAIAKLRHTPAGAFGSCRHKLPPIERDRRQYERLIEVFAAHDIGYFLYNGGGDSADTCLKIARASREMGYPIGAIHIPKTVDNDLAATDNCPGFGSVAKYIAVSTREASLDVASMAKTSTKVFVLEVMGRHAGWIAAASAMASSEHNPLPIIVLLPEIAFDRERFCAHLARLVRRHGYASVVVSEGVRDARGAFLAEQGLVDAFGHAQLGGVAPVIAGIVKRELNYKYHFAIADYLQRSARHIAARVDVEQAYAVGRAAVEFALAGKNAVMPAIKRLSDSPYRWKITAARLDRIANIEKKMPRGFITANGFGITAKCRTYLAPLMRGEDYPPYKNGLPDYARLKNIALKKKTKTEFTP